MLLLQGRAHLAVELRDILFEFFHFEQLALGGFLPFLSFISRDGLIAGAIHGFLPVFIEFLVLIGEHLAFFEQILLPVLKGLIGSFGFVIFVEDFAKVDDTDARLGVGIKSKGKEEQENAKPLKRWSVGAFNR